MNKRLLPLNHKYSVNSGVFGGVEDDVYMGLNEYGQYKYLTDKAINDATLEKLNKVDIMSDYSENEGTLSKKMFGDIKGIKHDKTIGYYSDLYAGYVKESDFRKAATSGGFGTWILCELLRLGEIDGVIHPHAVDPKENEGILFKYQISRTESEVRKGAKTRYYPMELSGVLKEVKKKPGRYAVIGISEFISELRLLCEQESVFKERIVYMIGLFNAHQKTTKYAEALAWQQGIKPGDLESVDFRVKNPNNMAWNYQCTLRGVRDGKQVAITEDMSKFPIHHWNMGFFKNRFSDFTDNAFNELADITLGDAWLPEYAQDPKGTNILIVRNPKIGNIIKKAIKEDRVALDRIEEEKIIASQGMLSHIIGELPYRLYKNGRFGRFVPQKRTRPSKNIHFLRRRVQDLRQRIVNTNDRTYKRAVSRQDLDVYMNFVRRYNKINSRLYSLMAYIEKVKSRRIYHPRNFITIVTRAYHLLKHKTRFRTRARKVLAIFKNKKVDGAILTLCDDFNYGNVMQRYALQKFLHNNNLEFLHLSFYTHYLQSVREGRMNNSLSSFIESNIDSRTFDASYSVGYKNYIVGSDQVWRNHGTDDLEHDFMPYWLSFLDGLQSNRIAYAASFGVDSLPEAYIDKALVGRIRPLLQKFNKVSVREKSGVKLVDEIIGKKTNPKMALDPTLLLSSEDYSKLIDESEAVLSKSPRLFCYILDLNKNKTNIVKTVAKQYNLDYKIVTANPNEKPISVEEWLKGYRDSEFVVTDSFHGTVFSIINKKDFIVLANRERGLARLESLLDLLDIPRDRLVFSDEEKPLDRTKLKPINWVKVSQRLEKLRQDSGQWLIDSIKGYK